MLIGSSAKECQYLILIHGQQLFLKILQNNQNWLDDYLEPFKQIEIEYCKHKLKWQISSKKSQDPSNCINLRWDALSLKVTSKLNKVMIHIKINLVKQSFEISKVISQEHTVLHGHKEITKHVEGDVLVTVV